MPTTEVHLDGGAQGKTLCGEDAIIAVTQDIAKCDCAGCLWKLAQLTLVQLTGLLAQIHRTERSKVVVIGAPAARRG